MPIEAANQDSTPLPFRNDTLLGVCEAIGRELGFNPTWLRVAFAALLFADPVAVVAAYVGLGLAVAAILWLIRDSKPAVEVGSRPLLGEAAKPSGAANQSGEEGSLPAAA